MKFWSFCFQKGVLLLYHNFLNVNSQLKLCMYIIGNMALVKTKLSTSHNQKMVLVKIKAIIAYNVETDENVHKVSLLTPYSLAVILVLIVCALKISFISLVINLNMCFGCSKELSH